MIDPNNLYVGLELEWAAGDRWRIVELTGSRCRAEYIGERSGGDRTLKEGVYIIADPVEYYQRYSYVESPFVRWVKAQRKAAGL